MSTKLEGFPRYRDRIPADVERFTFAGLAFPRYVATVPRVSAYRTAPRPAPDGWTFYLESGEGAPFALRWAWADELPGDWCDDAPPRIDHRGWLVAGEPDGDAYRGLVLKLPSGRGYLAGWSLGEGMVASVSAHVWDDAADAARAADREAELAADRETQYQHTHCYECGAETEPSDDDAPTQCAKCAGVGDLVCVECEGRDVQVCIPAWFRSVGGELVYVEADIESEPRAFYCEDCGDTVRATGWYVTDPERVAE